MFLLYCRAGFEADCAAELAAAAHAAGSTGRAQHEPGRAHVLWMPGKNVARGQDWTLELADLVFARQLVTRCRRIELPLGADRIAAIVDNAKQFGARFLTVWVEAPDDEPGRKRLAAAHAFSQAVETAIHDAGLIENGRQGRRLHICLIDDASVVIGMSDSRNSSPWPMGIPRLKFPDGAPSRSALKLVEALETFIGTDRLPERMRATRAVVDLGAAPGGWSYVLAQRGMRVIAVDNGPLAESVLATQFVEHRREDAFRFRPERPVDWLTCDVVAAPARIAALVAQWFARGWCREAIFNLKLPNRDRWQEVQRCQGVIEKALAKVDGKHALAIKHLYHDREEVTAHLRRL